MGRPVRGFPSGAGACLGDVEDVYAGPRVWRKRLWPSIVRSFVIHRVVHNTMRWCPQFIHNVIHTHCGQRAVWMRRQAPYDCVRTSLGA